MRNTVVFFNVGWMEFYRGRRNDNIEGGGRWVNEHGWGSEIFNFKPFNGRLYGYVQPKINETTDSTIRIEKLGATKNDASINNITVVWTAKHPINGGTYIVGWYKNATVFRYYQDAPQNSNRRYDNSSIGFYTTAKEKDCKLLPLDERIVLVRRGEGWMGQSNVWYAFNQSDFVEVINNYIFRSVIPKKHRNKKTKSGVARQPNILKRIEIEKRAISTVIKHYEGLGYSIKSYERDNLGWDLEAELKKTKLLIEVKGLSGKDIATELTPNEYEQSNLNRMSYRICVVTQVLTKPTLQIFSFSNENGQWISDKGTQLQCEEKVSARIYV